MNYIVFDLEWNQSPDGKKNADSRLPFEIIEIGAVKLNEQKEIVDSFHRLIRPQVYNWIHDSIHEVIHVDYKDLKSGVSFVQAAEEFLEWCGLQWYFFTWGNQDVMELQRNMKYFGMLEKLPGPVKYYDVQKLFAARYGNGQERRALEYAIDCLGIEKNKEFHRALADAHYTAEVLRCMEDEYILPNFSLDVYQNPKSRKEEIHVSCPAYDLYVSREFADKDRVMKDREVNSTRCPVCRLAAKRKVRWFANNPKVFYSVSMCSQHGYVVGKIRIRRTEEDRYYAVKKLRLATEEEVQEIQEKREALRLKRRQKRHAGKE